MSIGCHSWSVLSSVYLFGWFIELFGTVRGPSPQMMLLRQAVQSNGLPRSARTALAEPARPVLVAPPSLWFPNLGRATC
jgi:hypothetical protein